MPRLAPLALLAGILAIASVASAQQQPMFVNDIEKGMVVTTQGCVKPSERAGAYVFTQVMTWPIVRSEEGVYGRRHFAIDLGRPLDEFIGDTLQLTGEIIGIRRSEIELEPGLHRFGHFVEFERPDGNILVRPETIGLTLDRRAKRDDIPITLLEYKIDKVMRVMRGCLRAPGALTARRR